MAANNNLRNLAITVVGLVALNIASDSVFKRFDLTQDKRYSLSETSLNIVDNVQQPLFVDVFLDGQFPGEFRKLQTETRQLLEEFKAQNPNIRLRFINPLDDSNASDADKKELIYNIFKLDNPIPSPKDEAEIKKSIDEIPDLDKALLDSFAGTGMMPARLTVNDKGKQSEAIVFPWALATYEGKSVKVPLLKGAMGASTAEKIVSSVQHLEYAFSNAFNTVSTQKEKKIAVIKGNGQMPDIFMADFIKTVRDNYFIGTFTLDSVAKKPEETLKYLQKYDLAVMVKPTEAFTDAEKQVLDQYVMKGGKSLWLIDEVAIEMDSLMNQTGSAYAMPRNLNLTDLLFKYGVRLNPTLVKDLQNTPIALATGEQGSATQYMQYPWFYSPLVYPMGSNPIVTNLDAIKLDFASGIDTLKNGIKKTVLLQSSPTSKTIGTPVEVSLGMVEERPDLEQFKGKGNIPMAVLLEGKFQSAYTNRILPFEQKDYVSNGVANKMIVISDADIIKNNLDANFQPLELGFDKWTNRMYSNKEFLMNSVNYLLDDNGLINIRNKEVKIPVLDQEKVYANYTTAQVLTIGIPLVLLLVFGLVFNWIRSRKYGRKC